jgi:hypothetical protein
MPYCIAGIDVHKMLMVVVAEVTEEGEWSYERGKFGATAYELHRWAEWFQQQFGRLLRISSMKRSHSRGLYGGPSCLRYFSFRVLVASSICQPPIFVRFDGDKLSFGAAPRGCSEGKKSFRATHARNGATR